MRGCFSASLSGDLRRDSPSTDRKAGTHAVVGGRQLEEGPIVLDFLLPANQDWSDSLESPVRALHSPSSSTIAGDMHPFPSFFSPGADVFGVSFSTGQASDLRIVLSFVPSEVLGIFLGRKRR